MPTVATTAPDRQSRTPAFAPVPWHGGQLLAYSGLDGTTDYQDGLVARTDLQQPGLQIKAPGEGQIRFETGHRQVILGNDNWELPGTPLRGAFLDTHHLLCEGPVTVTGLAASLRSHSFGGRTLVGHRDHFRPELLHSDLEGLLAQRRAWTAARALPPGTPPLRARTFARALALMRTQVYTPQGNIRHRWTTPDRWPHKGMWLWDSAFHAIGWRHLDPALAREMIAAVFDAQREDGFVPHFITPGNCSAITQPPVLGLAMHMVNQVARDLDWIAALYPRLAACVSWDLRHRDTDGDGLVEWFIEGDPHCRSGESGMDNSPRFDSARQLAATDFNAYLCHECEVLAEFAASLGQQTEVARWQAEAVRLRERIGTQLFSPEAGLFLDFDTQAGRHSPVLASSGFLPLICRAASPAQFAQMLRHLDDPGTFGSAVPLPSAIGQATERRTDMWRGPMWVCVNWLVAYGLERYGEHARAAALRERTVTEIERRFDEYGVFFEYYDAWDQTAPPRTMRKGRIADPDDPNPFPHQVIHDFGWTFTLYVDMVKTLARA